MQGADASCRSTVEMWIPNLQDFCPFLSLGGVVAGVPSQSLDLGHKALFPAQSTAAQGCGSPGRAAREGVGWGCQHFPKYSPVTMETGSPHLKFQCSQCSPLTGLMGDEKLMFDLHVIAVLWDHSPCPSAGAVRLPGRLLPAAEHSARSTAPLVPAADLCGASAAIEVLTCQSMEGLAGEPQNPPSRDGVTGVLLEVWGWQLLRPVGLPARAPAASREDRHRVPAWRVPVPLLATIDCHHD